jgi:hypothetical protein
VKCVQLKTIVHHQTYQLSRSMVPLSPAADAT